jgi:hypothetical protein
MNSRRVWADMEKYFPTIAQDGTKYYWMQFGFNYLILRPDGSCLIKI